MNFNSVRRAFKNRAGLGAFFLFFAGDLGAQTPTRVVVSAKGVGPSLYEIVLKAVANDELRHEHRLGLECDQIITTERLRETGEVFKSKIARIVHREKPESLSTPESQAASEQSGEWQDGDTVKAEHRVAVMNLRRLAPRFQYTQTADATVRGRVCYVIEYSPRPNQPAATREEKVVNQLHGRFMIDKKTYEIVEGEGSLVAPVGVALFTSVAKLDFTFHTQLIPGGEVGPAEIDMDLSITSPFHFYRQHQISRLENWRPGS